MARKFLTPIDLSQLELQNCRVQNLGSAPGAPVSGQIYYDTGSNKLFWYNGTTWVDSTGGGIPASTVTTKGDLVAATASATVTRQAVGADNTFLVAASGQSTGLQWRALVAGDIGAALLQEKLATTDLTDWPRTAALDLNGQKLTGMADGTATTDGATFGQLSGAVAGFDWKEPVRAATTASITLTATQTIDGVAVAVGDRVLVKNQATPSQNGVYTVAAGAWTRTPDMDVAAEVNRATVLITEGTVGQGDIYQQTAIVTTLGTDTVTWVKVAEGNAIYSADGATLTLTGTTFSITNGGVGASQLAAAVAGNGLTGGGGSALAVGAGTGVSVAADTVAVDTTVVARKYTTTVGDGAATSYVITHNLGNQWCAVQVFLNSGSFAQVDCDIELTSSTTCTLRFATAPASAAYRVVVIG